MNTFEQLLADKEVLLADGATGTNLFAQGLQSGDPPEFWNLDEMAKIKAHYRSFVEAGSDIILTNTFGANSYRLKLHKAESRVSELNVAAVKLAQEVIAESNRKVAIAGSIGPTGEIFEPIGTLSVDDAFKAFKDQCDALHKAGADVLWIETMSSTEEIIVAVQAAQTTGLPVVYTASIDTNGKTMMGLSCADVVTISNQFEHSPSACGTNCGVGASEVVGAIVLMKKALPNGILVAKANCGIPEFINGVIHYNGTPKLMAEYAVLSRDAGAKIIGGCCGTSPEHIAAMRHALDNIPSSKDTPSLETIEQVLGEVSKGMRAEFEGNTKPPERVRNRRRKN